MVDLYRGMRKRGTFNMQYITKLPPGGVRHRPGKGYLEAWRNLKKTLDKGIRRE